MREQSEIVAGLAEVVDQALVFEQERETLDLAEILEPVVGEGKRPEGIGAEIDRREAGREPGVVEPGKGTERGDLEAERSRRGEVRCRHRRIILRDQADHRGIPDALGDRRREAGVAIGRGDQAGLRGQDGEGVGRQTAGQIVIVAAVAKRIAAVQFFVGVIAANQPVEAIVERAALQAHFLAEGLEPVECGPVVRPVGEIKIRIIDVGAANEVVVAIGGDRGQFRGPEVIRSFGRNAPVLHIAAVGPSWGNGDIAIIGIGRDDPADPHQDRREGGGDAVRPAAAVAERVRNRKIGGRATFLVALRIITDDPERESVARLVQQLPAQQPAVAIIDVAARDEVVQEAVALHVDAVDPRRQSVGDRAGQAKLDPAQVVIADRRLAISFGAEARLGGDDMNQTRGRVAAEQGALRATQHFDPVDRAHFGQSRAGA